MNKVRVNALFIVHVIRLAFDLKSRATFNQMESTGMGRWNKRAGDVLSG